MEETRKYWEACRESLRNSVLIGVVSTLIGAIMFIYQNAFLASLIAGILGFLGMIAIFSLLVDKIPERTKNSFHPYSPVAELGHLVTLVGAYPYALLELGLVNQLSDWFSLISLVGWVIFVVSIKEMDQDQRLSLLHRDVAIFSVSFVIFAIAQALILPVLSTKLTYIYAILPAVTVGIMYLITIGTVALGVTFIRSKLEQDAE